MGANHLGAQWRMVVHVFQAAHACACQVIGFQSSSKKMCVPMASLRVEADHLPLSVCACSVHVQHQAWCTVVRE